MTLKELGRPHDAKRDFVKSLTLARAAHSPVLEGKTFANLADAELQANDLASAETAIAQGMSLTGSLPPDVKAMLYGVAAEAALRRHDLGRARNLIEQGFTISRGASSKTLTRNFEKTAYEIYKASGDEAKSLYHLERFKQLDDQARAVAASTQAALMSAKFEFAKQNASLAEQQATIQRNQLAFQRRLLAAGTLILVLLLIGFFSIRRSRNQVRAANEELTGTNAELERALAARTEFLATTSHEIRTPLNGILGMTQVLLADRALPPDVKGKIELVKGAGETMKALVDDILDVAKITNGELVIRRDEMDLARLLRDAAQVWEAQIGDRDVAIELDIGEAPERIVEDEVRLRQIVFNLMANAVKFTDRGAVRLAAVYTPDQSPDSGCGMLRIAITDTGIGIPPDRLEDIFESFRQIDGGTTRRHGGTGLGLAICRNLARMMDGDVTVTSILGGGSTFVLELPCTPIVRAHVSGIPKSLAETRMLLVETNPLSRSMVSAVLSPHVGRLIPAGEVAEAREAMASDAIELIVADAGVFGLDIDAAAHFARAAGAANAATVLLWPSPDDHVRSVSNAAGILRIIAKPIAAQDLVAALKDIYMTDASPEEIAA